MTKLRAAFVSDFKKRGDYTQSPETIKMMKEAGLSYQINFGVVLVLKDGEKYDCFEVFDGLGPQEPRVRNPSETAAT